MATDSTNTSGLAVPWVDRSAVRDHIPDIRHQCGLVKFVPQPGGTIPSPLRLRLCSTATTNVSRRARRSPRLGCAAPGPSSSSEPKAHLREGRALGAQIRGR